MDNFEYSIQLNDRDWAEFYLASEECNLIQPALAIAEEHLLSDIEDGGVEEGRLIRVRVSPALAQSSTGHLPYEATDGPLEREIWSGSEDETDLDSVNRFLCKNRQLGTVCPQSQKNLLPHNTLKLLGATECDISCTAEERQSDTGDFLSVVTTTLKEDFLGQKLKEKFSCIMETNRDTLENMSNSEGENRSSTLLLLHPKDDAVQAATGDNQLPTLLENTGVGGSPEYLGPRDPAGSPTSIPLSSLDSPNYQRVEHLKKGMTTHQITLMAKMVSCQEEPSSFHTKSVPAIGIPVPTHPLPESHEEGAEKRIKAEKGIANLSGEGRVDPSQGFSRDVCQEESPLEQVVTPTSEEVRPEVQYIRPTATVDSTLHKHRDDASLTRGPEEENSSGSYSSSDVSGPPQERCHVMVPENWAADFLQESISHGPTLETSPESNVMTWPEVYDCFFCDDTHGQGGNLQERTGEESQDLPEMYGPEMYEYFFNEMGEVKIKRGNKDKISTSGQSAPPEDPDVDSADSDMNISVPEVYEHFFVSGTNDKRTWRGIFLSMEAKKAARALKWLVCKPAHLLKSRSQRQEPLLRRGSQERLVLLSPRLLQEIQPRAEDPAMAVMIPERPLRSVFSQRNMCLGFVAFASWAVKTSNLQSPDAWKIVFLANFGTLSAIRYYRRQVVVGGQHGT